MISEYGYCACTAERPEGDAKRIDVLREHDAASSAKRDYVAGLIFFCYNDYRTHIGDKGAGVMKQRVHGVVDLYGRKKPSWDVLRASRSPIESVNVSGHPKALKCRSEARKYRPFVYLLRGYRIRGSLTASDRFPLNAVLLFELLAPGAIEHREC